MGAQTGIEWTDSTWNLAWGCTKISPGCANCYADTLSARFGKDVWGPKAPRMTMSPAYWAKPLAWDRAAKRAGIKRRVFCSSMCDVFEDHPTIDQEREKLWPLIKATPNLVWQILTKRADRIASCLPADWGEGYPNVWLGVSIENAQAIQERMPHLSAIPAEVKFASFEPLLGSIRFISARIDWVIVGGESGHGARPMNPEWVWGIKKDCEYQGIKFFFKQWGEFNEAGERVGKKNAGRMLDWRTWDEMPVCWNGGVI